MPRKVWYKVWHQKGLYKFIKFYSTMFHMCPLMNSIFYSHLSQLYVRFSKNAQTLPCTYHHLSQFTSQSNILCPFSIKHILLLFFLTLTLLFVIHQYQMNQSSSKHSIHNKPAHDHHTEHPRSHSTSFTQIHTHKQTDKTVRLHPPLTTIGKYRAKTQCLFLSTAALSALLGGITSLLGIDKYRAKLTKLSVYTVFQLEY